MQFALPDGNFFLHLEHLSVDRNPALGHNLKAHQRTIFRARDIDHLYSVVGK